MWSKQQVANWVSLKCEECEIDENEVSKLKSLNGKGLDRLSKESWIGRSKDYGDLFFDMWQELKQTKLKSIGGITDEQVTGRKVQATTFILYFVADCTSFFHIIYRQPINT